jgi:hypothetical protein
MLHRAIAHSLLESPLARHSLHTDLGEPSEFTVFFECPLNANPEQRLQRLLALVWQMPEGGIYHYNLATETELRTHWCWAPQQSDSRDLTLLQTGHGPDGDDYANPTRTLLLVGPHWHTRLAAAQELAARTLRMRVGQALVNQAVARVRAQKAVAA